MRKKKMDLLSSHLDGHPARFYQEGKAVLFFIRTLKSVLIAREGKRPRD